MVRIVNAIINAASKNLLPASFQSRDLIQFLVEQRTPSEPVSSFTLLPCSPLWLAVTPYPHPWPGFGPCPQPVLRSWHLACIVSLPGTTGGGQSFSSAYLWFMPLASALGRQSRKGLALPWPRQRGRRWRLSSLELSSRSWGDTRRLLRRC